MRSILFQKFTLLVGCFFAQAITLQAQYSDYLNTPKIVSADRDVFEKLFSDAKTQPLRFAMFGDSQETTRGAGREYIPYLNSEFSQYYGSTPESIVAPPMSYSDEWLLAGSSIGQVASQTSGSDLLPSQRVARFIDTPSYAGLLAQLNLNATNTPWANRVGNEFNTNNVRIELIARDFSGSSEIRWRVNLNPDDEKSYFGGQDIGIGTTSLGLGNGSDYYTAELGTFSVGSQEAIQVIARGTDSAGVDLLGARFINEDNPYGISIQSFSRGGYRASDLFDNHSDASEAFNALGKQDAIMLHFGANDAGSRTAVEFEEDLQQLIDRFRNWADDDDLPVILLSDPDRIGLSAGQRAEFDQFSGVAAALAQSNRNVLAVNSRLLAHEAGWFHEGDDFELFVRDGVHYETFGAESLARLEANALLSLTAVPEPNSIGAAFLLCLALISRRSRVKGDLRMDPNEVIR